jgi:hypothetical protein
MGATGFLILTEAERPGHPVPSFVVLLRGKTHHGIDKI